MSIVDPRELSVSDALVKGSLPGESSPTRGLGRSFEGSMLTELGLLPCNLLVSGVVGDGEDAIPGCGQFLSGRVSCNLNVDLRHTFDF